MQKIPLEEALVSVKFPVYGLTEEVCGLRYNDYGTFNPHGDLTINYRSERYAPFNVRDQTLSTFYVTSVSDSGKVIPKLVPQMHDISLGVIIRRLERVMVHTPFRWEGTLTIDGKAFSGCILYYPAPLCASACCFGGDGAHFDGKAFGPNVDELIQILESLHDLNGKAVE
jgi:hypothetical protein